MKYLYLLLTILGTALPYGAFLPWLWQHGFDLALLYQHASANPISQLAWLDVIVAAIVLIAFIVNDGKRNQVRHRVWAVIATFTIGVSAGLPLYLYLKACMESTEPATATQS
uniref:DUF2834 domain-containing protein n=1 Tax=Thaumasiovibrio occultus TaxID=1891184 RepID=UPI000B360329|nr:DUF2834 domain-containing protein [Thaumasiovibrio occultus]